jgi:hypothetical protein
MLRQWVSVTLSVLSFCSGAAVGIAAAESSSPAIDPFRLYGKEVRFDVERAGELIGHHVVTFTRTDQGVRADSRADIDVDFLSLSIYHLRYHVRELWSDGELQSIEASTNKNGKYTHVQAVRDAVGLQISSPRGTYEAPLVPPTTYWNAVLPKGGDLLNTMTGELVQIQVFDQGLDTVRTRNGSLRARHYLYSGDLNGEIWYDEDGRWVKLRFRAKDGSLIDYICRSCQAQPTITEAE